MLNKQFALIPKNVAAVSMFVHREILGGKVVRYCPKIIPSGVKPEKIISSSTRERCDHSCRVIRLKNTKDSIALCARMVSDRVACRDASLIKDTARPSIKQCAKSN